jgi:O-methyltransferase involved in polyketide biosynthesis
MGQWLAAVAHTAIAICAADLLPLRAAVQAASEAALPGVALRQSRGSVVARSRYAEERLTTRGYRQYVILGAGLDSG